MRGILLYILIFLGLSVAGCRGGRSYDSRLEAADSLVASQPDSALRILRGVGFDSMCSDADRAYFALLLTQAKYKCDETITSTDTIDIALDYFSDGSDADKRLRSLIYRGASLTDMGEITAAMEAYKQAEAAASPDDYENLGYINLRMASLYNKTYIVDSTDLVKYKKALYYYNLSGNKHYQLVCMSAIGTLNRTINNDTAYYYLTSALKLAEELDDLNNYYIILNTLAGYFFNINDYETAKNISLQIIDATNGNPFEQNTYYYLISSYIKLGKTDSALCYLPRIKMPTDSADLVGYFDMLSDLEKSKGDFEKANYYYQKSSDIAGDILHRSLQSKLIEAEAKYNKQTTELLLVKEKYKNNIAIIIILLLIILVLVIGILLIIKFLHIKNQENQIKQLQIEISNIINDNVMMSNDFKQSAGTLFSTIKNLVQSKNGSKKINNEDFIKIKSKLITDATSNKDFWRYLEMYVDNKYKGVITQLRNSISDLTESDIKLLCLIGVGFSNVSVTFLTDYSHNHSVCNRKRVIAEKMNIDCSIEEYFARLTK